MKRIVILIQSIGILFIGFAIVVLVNLPHDLLLNAMTEGSAKNYVPLGRQAEWLSIGIGFLAGVLASTVVGLLAKRFQKSLLSALLVLFLITDLAGVFGPLASTSLTYRLALVLLVPLEVGLGYLLSKQFRPTKPLVSA